MTATTLPPEVVAECVRELSRISVEVSRDGATLQRFVVRLMTGCVHGVLLGSLKRYARIDEQYGADEVEKVIATIEAAVDPEHLKHLALCKAQRDKEHAAFLEVMAAREEAAKPPYNGNVIFGPWNTAG